LGRLWYDLQDVDAAISYVSSHLERPDPDPPPRPDVLKRLQAVRRNRVALLATLRERRERIIREAMDSERRRHRITMEEMEKLLRADPQPAVSEVSPPKHAKHADEVSQGTMSDSFQYDSDSFQFHTQELL